MKDLDLENVIGEEYQPIKEDIEECCYSDEDSSEEDEEDAAEEEDESDEDSVRDRPAALGFKKKRGASANRGAQNDPCHSF